MPEGIAQEQGARGSRRRYTLRSLLMFSVALSVPIMVIANFRNSSRPEESVASPIYLLVGALSVLVFAAVGNALGRRAGTVVAALLAGSIWLGLVYFGGRMSDLLMARLPLHMVVIAITLTSLLALVWLRKDESETRVDQTIEQLIQVKSNLRKQQRKGPTDESDPGEQVRRKS